MNITFNPNAQTNAASLGTVTGVKNTDSEETTSAATATAATSKYDTVDFSEEAEQYLATENTETTTEETVASETAELVSEAADTEEISSDDLYSYTETQLAELLSNGDITQAEYDSEIARRAATSTAVVEE